MSADKGFVILHFGPMGVDAMTKASKLAGKDAVIDTDAARLAGATFAFGPSGALADLKARLAPAAIAKTKASYPGLPPAALAWLANGERGRSSEAIFQRLLGIDLFNDGDHPADPADLRRCRLLLEVVPGLEGRIGEMADISETWARFCNAWDDLCLVMDEEVPDWRTGKGSAPKTFRMMQEIQYPSMDQGMCL